MRKIIYLNELKFDQNGYGEDRVIKQSIETSFRTLEDSANFMQVAINKNIVIDQDGLLQLTPANLDQFYSYEFLEIQQSSARSWNNRFKFMGFNFEMGQQTKVIERQTYSLLDLLGDVGGLFDGLRYIVGYILAPALAFSKKVSIVPYVFTLRKKSTST